MNYHYILNKEDKGAVALANSELPLHKISSKTLTEVSELPFAYKIDALDKGKVQDLLGENKGIYLFSENFKILLDAYNEKSRTFDWVIVKVEKSGKDIIYFTPRFFVEPDLLDKSKTRFGGGSSIIIPCFSLEKINKLKNTNLFYFSRRPFHGGIGGSIIVSDIVKKKLTSEGITGVSFSKAKVE